MEERKKRSRQPDASQLDAYRKKRDFNRTAEPRGSAPRPSGTPLFVVQKHDARRLHYDLRLEADGVLKSWAVPKGPSYDPGEKRLAVQVEDHPLEYADFEGLIAERQYGAGTVMVWDRGTWEPTGDWKAGLEKGHLKFRLNGSKLKGQWSLIRIREAGKSEEFDEQSRDNWLLVKSADEDAKPSGQYDVTVEELLSVKTGRTMEAIREQKTAYWRGPAEASPPSVTQAPPAPPAAKGIPLPWPDSFSPQLATPVTHLPETDQWISEIKLDGYRIIARVRQGQASLITRGGQDWTRTFPAISRELTRLPIGNAILDGEVVVLDKDGTTSFQKLQDLLKRNADQSFVYYVFDIPYYEGHDLAALPLIERKALLRELLSTYAERMPSIRYSEHVEGSGEHVLRAACAYGVEGIIAKRSDSVYVQKRSGSWVKKKCVNRQEFVVGGFTDPGGARASFGSLLLGYYDDQQRLIYCGNVGTGFSEESIRTIYDRLKNLEQDSSPFAFPVDDSRRRKTHWTAPELAVEVEFSEWTGGGHLRHPSFVAIREDKKSREIVREQERARPVETDETVGIATNSTDARDLAPSALPREERGARSEPLPVKLSNPGKILYPAPGITKKELAEYYLQAAHWMLPEAANRPLVLVRCPEGINQRAREECFFQKHLRNEVPEWIRTVSIEKKGSVGLYPVIDDVKGLLSLAQLGVLEVHMLGCRADDVDHPDRMIFDLDPAPDVSTAQLIDAAHLIVDWLSANRMRSFLKLTGGKGIHIVVPINPALTWEELKKLSKAIAVDLVQRKPSWFVATLSKQRRLGKILIDHFRNSLGASSILPYSTRTNAEATVAFPISAEELTRERLSRPITLREAIKLLKERKSDPWEGMG